MRFNVSALAILFSILSFVSAHAQSVPIGVQGSVPICTHATLTAGTCQLAQPGYTATITNGNGSAPNACASGAGTGSDQITCRYRTGAGWTEFEPVAATGLTNPLTGDLDASGFDIVNPGGLGARQFYVSSQSELTDALAACDSGIGQDKLTGCTIWAEGVNATFSSTTALCGDGTAATGRNGIRIIGVGGGYGPTNTNQYANSGTVWTWTGGTAPMFTVGACSIEIAGIQFRGAGTATSAFDILNTSGAPLKMTMSHVAMHGFTGYAIQGNDGGGTPAQGQFDESTFEHVYIERSGGAISVENSQSIGLTLGPKFQVTNMNGNGPFINIDWGSASFVDGYCGLIANNQTCVRFGKNANKLVVNNVQFEGPGFTGLQFIDADDGAPAGNVRKLLVEGAQFIITEPGNVALDFLGRGSVVWSNNNYVDNTSATQDVLAVTIDRDATSTDRLSAEVDGNWRNLAGGTSTTPLRWIPTIATNVNPISSIISTAVLPESCGWWEVTRLTTAPAGQDIYTCVSGAWVQNNSASLTMAGDLTNDSPVDTSTVLSPSHKAKNYFETWFNLDGAKNEGCVDLYNVPAAGGATQTSGTPDGWCDTDSTQRVGKTKAIGIENDVVILTQTEGYGDWVRLISGADVDSVGRATDVFMTGGCQDGGDECGQDLRNFITDSYYSAEGTITGSLAAGAGNSVLVVSNLTETESKLVGENKLLVFANNTSAGAVAQDVELTSVPAGTFDTNPLPVTIAAGTWSTPGPKTWGLAPGVVGSTGVGPGWCLSPANSIYLDPNNVSMREWFRITASSAGSNTVQTEWIAQGVNYGIPYGTLAEIGANEARIAPCVLIGAPVFTGGPTDRVVDFIAVVRAAGFPGTDVGATFVISDYPQHTHYGARFLVGRRHGSAIPHYGLDIRNYFGEWGARQGGDALTVGGVGAASSLIDGASFHWLHGYRCLPEGAETCFRHDYKDNPNGGQFAIVNFGSTRYAAADTFNVIRVLNAYEDSLSHKPGFGWGKGITTFEPFALLVATGAEPLATASIASGACSTADTNLTATGTLATDTLTWSFNADVTAVTGYAPVTTGGLSVYAYPGAGVVSFKICNPTANPITPGAVTLNWRVIR